MTKQWNDDNKERVREAVPYKSYFEADLGRLVDAGESQVLAKCPFHSDLKNSLSINLDTGLWNCKGCTESGDIFTFHSKRHNLGGFRQAMEDLAKRYNVTIDQTQAKKGLPGPDQVDKFREKLKDPEWGGMDGLKESRGVTSETVDKFKLGYSTRRKRITIPVYNEHGALINVRLYNAREEFKMVSWSKGFGASSLYGLNDMKTYPMGEDLLICEGEWDRLLLCQAGFNTVTHTNGALSFQRSWKEHFNGRNVVLVYDGDGYTRAQARTAGPRGDGKDEEGREIKAQGGRGGSENTAGILSGVVKSLKIIDLKTANLVRGTEDDNDIGDMRRNVPGWPEKLREAIKAADGIDLTSKAAQASSQAFVSLYVKDGMYWVPGKNKDSNDLPVSNFLIEPVRRIRVENEEILEARANLGSGKRMSDMVLHPAHFASKAALKRILGDLGAGWVGSENQIQELKVFLSLLDCPKYESEQKLGIHEYEKEWILVASDKTLTASGEIEDLIHWSEQVKQVKYEISSIRPANNDEVAAIAQALIEFNDDFIQAGVIGWMMSLPFKARLIKAVPTVRRQFPILNLWGERGAGKTQTADRIILPFYGNFEGSRKVDEMTKYTLMLAANSTNFLPIALDEYKPSKMGQGKAQEISSFLRGVYDSQTGERGFSDSTGSGVKSYTYTAPVIIMGEQSLFESALKERITEMFFTKRGREGKRHIEVFQGLPMAEAGLWYVKWSLSLSNAEIGVIWQKEFADIDPIFEDRIRQNIATVRMGLRIWEKFLFGRGIVMDVSDMVRAVDESQKSAMFNEGGKQESDVDKIIEALSTMAALRNENIKRGRDWDLMHDDSALALRLKTMYPVFKKWAREHDFEGEIMDLNSFRKQLKNEKYYVGRQPVRMYESAEGTNSKLHKSVILEIQELQKAGIDLSGFDIKEEEKDE